MTIGERIKKLRKKNNLTQEKLADFLCISTQAISKWECGLTSPDLSLIGPLTKLFGVSADELLGLGTEKSDVRRTELERIYQGYRDIGDHMGCYQTAYDAVIEYPEDFHYLEWLACSEYNLAFDENQKKDSSVEYFDEFMDRSLRHYDYIIENCTDCRIRNKAILGKIVGLRFTERLVEADWSAEFEYPDNDIRTAEDALILCREGRELLAWLKME